MTNLDLDRAAADPRDPEWDRIWEESVESGEAAPGSEELLPWLARTIAGFAPDDRDQPLVMSGLIALDADDRETYSAAIATLRAMTSERLGAGTQDDEMYVYLQQAVLAYDGNTVWGKQLDRLNDGEIDVSCAQCGEETLVGLGPEDPYVRIEPALPDDLAVQLHAAAVAAGRDAVAAGIARLFGTLDCPACGTPAWVVWRHQG